MTATTTPITREQQFATLTRLLGSEERATAAMARLHPEPEPVSPLQELIAAGFSPEDAAKVLSAEPALKVLEPVAQPPAPPAEPTNTERAEALVTEASLVFGRGRTYIDAALILAFGEVMKTGEPLLVPGEREGRFVLVYKSDTENASVIAQNVVKPRKRKEA